MSGDGDHRELRAVLAVVEEAAFRGELSAVADALDAGTLGPVEQATLEHLLELGLHAGRIRPHGTELDETAHEVADALHDLEGFPLRSVELRAVGPGAFALSLSAGMVELDVRLDRHGARLAGVAARSA
jgi:hypothetical protein